MSCRALQMMTMRITTLVSHIPGVERRTGLHCEACRVPSVHTRIRPIQADPIIGNFTGAGDGRRACRTKSGSDIEN